MKYYADTQKVVLRLREYVKKKGFIMQGGFVKFKKEQAYRTLVNSLILGIAAALFAVGGLLLISKLSNTVLPWFVYVLSGVGGFIAAGGVFYFFCRGKDKKLAKRLDKEFALNERVQTMIEFQDTETPMIRLQRTDTQERLESTPLSKLRWKGIWACLTALACAAAIFVIGLAMPKAKAKGNDISSTPPKIEFVITDLQKTRLASLIQSVEDSSAEEVVKTTIVTQLKELQLSLDEIKTPDELYEKIAAIIVVVDGFVEDYNTYKRVYEVIRANDLIALQQLSFSVAFNDLPDRIALIKAELSSEDEDSATALLSIAAFVNGLRDSLALLEENEADGLMVAFATLLEDLDAVAALDATTYKYDKVFDALTNAFNENVKDITLALNQQTENRTVTSNTIERLIAIFNVPLEKIPPYGGAPLEGLEDSGKEPSEKPKPGDGIIIDGMIYPSNETVYDYYIKVICAYGKVFENEEHAHNYKKEMYDLISAGVADGTITPEVEEMLRSYIDALSGSPADDNQEQQD